MDATSQKLPLPVVHKGKDVLFFQILRSGLSAAEAVSCSWESETPVISLNLFIVVQQRIPK